MISRAADRAFSANEGRAKEREYKSSALRDDSGKLYIRLDCTESSSCSVPEVILCLGRCHRVAARFGLIFGDARQVMDGYRHHPLGEIVREQTTIGATSRIA